MKPGVSLQSTGPPAEPDGIPLFFSSSCGFDAKYHLALA
eukprot:CAMPEP_0181054328 /NCGR_PEP_ID=MMETSP1070-20121207/18617_1 /TAXON_ID=265543 /ORGANISM="Minutocellus polymorphus, Strain NH13" /LENGTH=38 /DNA_ID= /DNA_START= /DNA_END= /DNA_ORIENTATION=